MLTYDQNMSSDSVVPIKTKESASRSKSTLSKNILNQLKDVGYSMHSIIYSMEMFAEAVQEMDETILLPSRLMDLKIEDPADCKSIAALSNLSDLYVLYNTVHNIRTQMQWGCKEPADKTKNKNGQEVAAAVAAAVVVNKGQNGGELKNNGSGPGSNQNQQEDASLLNNNGNNNSLLSSSPVSALNNNNSNNSSSSTSSNNIKGHVRRPSTASMTSVNSSAASTISESESEGSVENDSGIDADMEKKPTTLENIEMDFQKHLGGLRGTLKQLTEAAKYVTKRYQRDVLGIF